MTDYEHIREKLDRLELNMISFGERLQILARKVESEIVTDNDTIEKMEVEGHVREKK